METQNPIVIMLINMTIVFAVLFVLSLYIRLIHTIDPTAKAAAAPKAAPKAAPAPKTAAPAPIVEKGSAGETVAAIAAALATMGVGFSRVKAIRVADRPAWGGVARHEGLTTLKMS